MAKDYSGTRNPISKTMLGKLGEALGLKEGLTFNQIKTKIPTLSQKVVRQALKKAGLKGAAAMAVIDLTLGAAAKANSKLVNKKSTTTKADEIGKRTSVINEKASTLKKQKQIKRGIDKSLEEVKREAGFPQKRPKMNKGGMPKKSHAKPGSYSKAYMMGGMAKKKK